MRSNSSRSVQQFFNKSGCPVTVALIVINVIGFLTNYAMQDASPFRWLLFTTLTWPQYFWTAVTWPLVGMGEPWYLLFASLWALSFCGSLERSWGTRTYFIFFIMMSAITAFSVWLGAMVFHKGAALASLWIAIGPPTVAWCTINRRERISVWGVITVPAAAIGAFACVLVWFEVRQPTIGMCALSSCAAAYWYANGGRYAFRGYSPAGRGGRPGGGNHPNLRMHTYDRESVSSGSTWSPARQFKAWQEKRKLERLWKRSFTDDKDRGQGNGKP